MKIQVYKPVEIDVRFVRVNFAVSEDVAGILPDCLIEDGQDAEILINVDTGQIVNWDAKQPLIFEDKLGDSGTYILLDENQNQVAQIQYGYVPNGLVPGEYGDYIRLEINAEGRIENWPEKPNLTEFFEDDE